MLKWKILLMLALYIILGVIVLFNFGFYHHIAESVQRKAMVNDAAWEDFDGSIQDPQTEATEESQGSPLVIETNN
jgi:hypothetical protein